jgi:hypothetical protein
MADFKFSRDAPQAGFTSCSELRIFLAGKKQIEIFATILRSVFPPREFLAGCPG